MTFSEKFKMKCSRVFSAIFVKSNFVYFLGLVGWIVVLANAPFDWDLPTYAAY